MTRPCGFLIHGREFCGHVTPHAPEKLWMIFAAVGFVIGLILWMKALNVPDDIPPPLKRWPFGD